jgi:hypothetical protein
VLADPKRVAAGDVVTRKEQGRTRLIFRWSEGASVVATFDWGDPVVFEAEWPRGAKQPEPVGWFCGVPDFPAPKVGAFLCSCALIFNGKPAPADCKLGYGGFGGALECLRAHFPSDCEGYRECITMEPSSYAECEPDEQNTGFCPSCRCAIQCGDGKPACPPGMACTPSQREGNECVFE